MQSFDEYQDASARFAVYPERGSGSKMALLYAALGLQSEVGEVASLLKKYIRGDVNTLDLGDVAKELGDCQWYIAALASEINYRLANIAEGNLAKLQSRKDRGVIKGNGDER